MQFQGTITEVIINQSGSSALCTVSFTDCAGKTYTNQPLSLPAGILCTPSIGQSCSYSSVGSPYTSTGVLGIYSTQEVCPLLFQGTPITNAGNESAVFSAGIALKIFKEQMLATFNGDGGVKETGIIIGYNAAKALIDILGFLVNTYPNHTHSNGNGGSPTGAVIAPALTDAITDDQNFFGSDANTSPTYINKDGKLIGS